MYDLRSDQEVISYQDTSLNAGVTSVALSNSGRLIFAGYDDFNCHIWDSLKGEKVGEQTNELINSISLIKISQENDSEFWVRKHTYELCPLFQVCSLGTTTEWVALVSQKMGWVSAQDPGTVSSNSGTEAS